MKDKNDKEIKIGDRVKIDYIDHHIFEKANAVELQQFLEGEYAVDKTGKIMGENDDYFIVVTWDGTFTWKEEDNPDRKQYDGYGVLKSAIREIEIISHN